MEYKKIKPQNMSEQELRELWHNEYCIKQIVTLDNIVVRFFDSMFDHAFYESDDWKEGDKSIFSLFRLQRMLWIKDVLRDPEAILKQGWDKHSKSYTKNRRVSFVKGNYVVVIRIISQNKAQFVTAYEVQSQEKIAQIAKSPGW